jgi:hypothetical protein
MPYQQFLVTRYNVEFEAAAEAGVDPFSSGWLQHRDKLFQRYCVPSVRNQVHRDFDWFVMFHPDTPRQYLDAIDGIGIAILARTTREATEIIQRDYIQSETVIASRIDNDDAIAPDFMHRVRATVDAALNSGFADGQDFAVSFCNGIVVHAPSQKWRPRSAISPPFLTLVEHLPAGKSWRSPLGVSHVEVPELFPMMSLNNKAPMWAFIVHERNISNQVLWESATRDDLKLRSFPRRFPSYKRWRTLFIATVRHVRQFCRRVG